MLYDRLTLAPPGRSPIHWARIDPWPLPEGREIALRDRGWRIEDRREPRLRHLPSGIEARLVGFAAERWPGLRALGAYLKRHPGAASGRRLDDPGLEREAVAWALRAWGLRPLASAVRDLAGIGVRWHVASGWALDLHRGAPSRLHDDVDIEIPRSGLHRVRRHLEARGWRLDVVTPHGYRRLDGRWTVPDDAHQVHARRAPLTRRARFLDLLLVPGDGRAWCYRRDGTVRPPDEVWLERRKIPYLAPEVVLLYKAEGGLGLRPKDDEDARRTLVELPEAARAWLYEALTRGGREHPWAALLEGAARARS